MEKWEKQLKTVPMEWLLEENNPSVRYFTLLNLLDLSDPDPVVEQAKSAIMQIGPVPRILLKQKPEGFWGQAENFYMYSKYRGTSHTMLILAQLGADPNDTRIKRMCEFILKVSQDPLSGGFSCKSTLEGVGSHSVEPCLTGNMTWALIQFGHLQDSRVLRAIQWITTYQRFDDGETRPPRIWPYLNKDNCWGKHTCHSGVVRSLKALSSIPKEHWTAEITTTAREGSDYLLKHHIFRRSHSLDQIAMVDWLQFAFPILVTTDLIEVLEILLDLGIRDDRMQESIQIILSRQQGDGKWLLDRSHIGRYQTQFERLNQPSKWITLRALKVIKKYYSTPTTE